MRNRNLYINCCGKLYLWWDLVDAIKGINISGVIFMNGLVLYSETTWAVGIAQLTHHSVQGGGKNPETEGRRIFAPIPNRVVS